MGGPGSGWASRDKRFSQLAMLRGHPPSRPRPRPSSANRAPAGAKRGTEELAPISQREWAGEGVEVE
eukprot:scaffold16555_cov130-Isochrysis_galbana.AAC.2